MKVNHTITSKQRRQIRVRRKVRGTTERPRLTVFRSNTSTSLQVIDDTRGVTLVSAHSKTDSSKGTKTERAIETAKNLIEKMKKAKIDRVVFDRGAYRYHGRVKAIADAVREGGIQV